MGALGPEQRELLAAYRWQRADGELTSWVGFQHVVADLRAESSPQIIIALAERAVEEERHHTERCRRWAVRFGLADGELTARGDKPIAFCVATDIQNRLLRITLCGMSEIVGWFVLRHARPLISDPDLREFNRRNMGRGPHSRVGWGHLAAIPPPKRTSCALGARAAACFARWLVRNRRAGTRGSKLRFAWELHRHFGKRAAARRRLVWRRDGLFEIASGVGFYF